MLVNGPTFSDVLPRLDANTSVAGADSSKPLGSVIGRSSRRLGLLARRYRSACAARAKQAFTGRSWMSSMRARCRRGYIDARCAVEPTASELRAHSRRVVSSRRHAATAVAGVQDR
jgi:hypothetical protein